MTEDKTILVYFDGEQVAEPLLMGWLTGTRVRGKELFSFEFDESWLRMLIQPGSSLGGARPKAN